MLYIGNFMFLANLQEFEEDKRRHGTFNLVVDAESHENAMAMFKETLLKLRTEKDFFEGDSEIYFTHLLEFEAFPKKEALLLNFKSIAGDPIMPFIGCTVPTADSDDCKIYNWDEGSPEIDGKRENLFVEFKD